MDQSLLRNSSRGDKITIIPEDHKVIDAAKIMRDNNISSLIVIDPDVSNVKINDHIVSVLKNKIHKQKSPSSSSSLDTPQDGTSTHSQDGHVAVHVVGIITSSDIVKSVANGHNPSEVKVRDIVSTHLLTCPVSMDLKDAAELMHRKKVHHIVVMDEKRLVGVVSAWDVAKQVSRENSQLPSWWPLPELYKETSEPDGFW